ncbi:Pentatricopeptide repeat-containing protein [Acorus gramineus]|uniref:Pentatricopeptide repeat-containing protein n=1 Tax=Acorus gramineus TaxID=55184 RepID=A0AAV9AIL4_ACOGR|nr:Pentatricopeptide repeat-containing protein [Acorus gramineus]
MLRRCITTHALADTNLETIARALRRCGRTQAVRCGRSLHARLIKLGSSPSDVFVANNTLSMYSDLSIFNDARTLFDEMPNRNVVSWTSLISAQTRLGDPSEALKTFARMLESEEPNVFAYSVALKACASCADLEMGRWIIAHVSRIGFWSDVVLMNSAIDMYVKCGSLGEARGVFDGMGMRNLTSWNTMIAGYALEGRMEEATKMFYRMREHDKVSWNTLVMGFARVESVRALEFACAMRREGFSLDEFTFPCVLNVCGSFGDVGMGQNVHSQVIKFGFELSCFIGSALIDMYAKCGKLDLAEKLFNGFSNNGGTVGDKLAIWNSMVSGYSINGCDNGTLNLVSKMHRLGMRLDYYTFSSVLKACGNLWNSRFTLQVQGLIFTCGFHLDSVVASVLVDCYVKCGNVRDAFQLFQMIPYKDTVSWAGMISGCTQHGLDSLACSLFVRMIALEMKVDQFITSSTLKACSNLAGLEFGKQVHAFCMKNGYESEEVTSTSLIDMYSKCGEIDDGMRVFESATQRDAVCWTGIIVGCGQNGRAKDAIRLFAEMLISGVEPNEITFVGVLSACRHAGMIEEACSYFKMMREQHNLFPLSEHFCCMIDLLGRAGKFEEAERLISEMPYNTSEVIWHSLLGGSRCFDNAGIGKSAAERVLSKSSNDTSMYVALSNVYAGLGMWDDSARLRGVMRKVGMKDAGKSWVELRI